MTDKELVPHHLDEAALVDRKSKGGLKHCTEEMFAKFHVIEKNLEGLLKDDRIFIRESFVRVMDRITSDQEVPFTVMLIEM